MTFWKWLLRRRSPDSGIRDVPKLATSSIQFGDRVRVLSDESTLSRGLVGKVGTVHGQTTPSVTHPPIIGNLTTDYAVCVFFEDTSGQLWFPEHLLELVDHGEGATA